MSENTWEIINKAHKYLICGSIIVAFFHFVYLYVKALKKIPVVENLSIQELRRVSKENIKNRKRNFKLMIRPFLVFLLYAFCITLYSGIAITFGWIW